jgi:hypothetical protein
MADDRQSPRIAAKSNLYFLVEPNNTATVLNVSDGGLGFHAFQPVTQAGKIRFSFPYHGKQFETSGELVWTDSTKQIGGLSFASLPLEERERIRRWADQEGTPKSAREAHGPAAPPPKESPRPFVAPSRTNASPIPSFTPPAIPLPQFANPVTTPFESLPQRMGYASDREMPFPIPPRKFFRGFLAGVILSAILAGFLFFTYSGPNKDWRRQLSEMIGASPKLQAAPAALPPPAEVSPPLDESGLPPTLPPASNLAAPAASGPLPALGVDSKTDSTHAKTAAEYPLANERVTSAAGTLPSKPADPGAEDLALAERYLNTMPGHMGSATASRYLWAAVEKGNVKAEITLANMYARGDGVTENCNQAQVLLRAASKRGNNEASQELAQIIRRGCR